MIEFYAGKGDLLEKIRKLLPELSDKEYYITLSDNSPRSIKLNKRFWGFLRQIWLGSLSTEEFETAFKSRALLFCSSIPDDSLPEGHDPWPMVTVRGIDPITRQRSEFLFPDMVTHKKTNRQLMTACYGLELLAQKLGLELMDSGGD